MGILCFTETWLDSSITDDEIRVNRYNLIRKEQNRKARGICVFIHEDINFNVIDMSVGGETLFLDVLIPASKALLFGVCYRPLNQTDFYEVLEDVLSNLNGFMFKEWIFMGDFNTDVSKKVGENYNAQFVINLI